MFLLDPSHSLGMTGLGPSPLRLCVIARDIPPPLSSPASQLIRRLDVKLDTASLLVNHHAIVTPGRFQRPVTRPHGGGPASRGTPHRVPDPPPPAGLDGKTIAFRKLGGFDLARRKSLNLAV